MSMRRVLCEAPVDRVRRGGHLEDLKAGRAVQHERSPRKCDRVAPCERGLLRAPERARARAHEQEPQIVRFAKLHRSPVPEVEHAGGGDAPTRVLEAEVAHLHTGSHCSARAALGDGMEEPLTGAEAIERAIR